MTGQNITLLCIAEGGNPPPQLLWSNNQKGQLNSTFVFDESSQVNFYEFFKLTINFFDTSKKVSNNEFFGL